MFKIQTLNTISTVGLNQFPRELYEIATELQHPDAILVRSQVMHDVTVPSTVKVIGRAGAGVNNIPVANFTKLGIPVLNTPGANANAVKELVIAGMLLACRNICQAWDYTKHLQGDDAALNEQVERDKKQFVGFELPGKTLGIIGLGSIGVKVANAAIGLGMRVVGFDPTITVKNAWELSSQVQQAHSVDSLLTQADFISLHVPLTNETRQMINAVRLQIAKPGAVLLNFSRDGIVDNEALLAALESKKIFAYVSDFPCVKLKDQPRAISLPHLGASTREAEENCALMIANQVRNFLEQGTIVNSVNFPTVEMPRNGEATRLAIANANVPNMVAQISTKLGKAKVNIIDLLNKSRDDIAYTLVDVNSDIDESLIKEIAAIDGVIQVRKLPCLSS